MLYIALLHNADGKVLGRIDNQPISALKEHYEKDGVFVLDAMHLADETGNIDLREKRLLMDSEPYSLVDMEIMNTVQNKQSIVADGQDTLIVSQVPIGAEIQLQGPHEDQWINDDGIDEITTFTPGKYQIIINKFPYKLKVIDFVAT